IIINQNREIVSVATTPANVHDVKMLKDDQFIAHIKGLLIGDKGYIMSYNDSKKLSQKGIQLLAKQRKNMDPYLNQYYKKDLQKRKVIETIFGYLKTRVSLLLIYFF
ncbi:transposase, partial [Candidatus Dependentiae bacterium]|nr:transposase [Candidatus Dependentiae bacterium]